MTPARLFRLLPRARAVALLLAAGLLIGAWQFGAFDTFGDAEKVHALLEAWGVWAYVIYVVSFVLLMPFGIPAFVWVLPAGIVWPFAVAYPLSLLAVAGGSSVGFLFARYIARDWVAARMTHRMRRLDESVSARGLRSVIVFRLVFQVGAPTHWLLGLSSIPYGTFVAGTVIGAMPVVALVAWFGHDVVVWVQTHVMTAVLLGVVTVGLLVVVRRILRPRRV